MHSNNDWNYEREKPSWRDIDRKKDKSKHIDGDKKTGGRVSKVRVEEAKKQYIEHINQLFMGKKGNTAHDKILNKLREGKRNPDFEQLLRSYITEYNFPDDWDTQMAIIDWGDPELSKKVIENVLTKIKEITPTRRDIFLSKINILRMTTGNRELAKFIKTIKID